METNEVIKISATTELLLPKPRNEGAAFVVRKLPSIIQQLPSDIDRGAWAAAVMSECNRFSSDRSNYDYVSESSLATAVYNLAFLGLMPGATLGHAYFVPFKNQATLIVGYKGYADLSYGTGFLKDIHTDVIVRDEEFKWWKDETGPKLLHTPKIDRKPNRSNIIGAYCLYHTMTGGMGLKVVPVDKILEVARFAKGNQKPTPWDTNFEAMCAKTPVRRAANEWKLTGRLGHALRIEDQADRDELQSLPPGLELDVDPVPAESYRLPIE